MSRLKNVRFPRSPRLERLLLNDLKREVAAAKGPEMIVDKSVGNMLDSIESLAESLLHYRKSVEKSGFLRQIKSVVKNGEYDLLRRCTVERSWGLLEKTALLKECMIVFRRSKVHVAYGAYVQVNLKAGPEIPQQGGIMLLGRIVHAGTGSVRSNYERMRFRSFQDEIVPQLSEIWNLQASG